MSVTVSGYVPDLINGNCYINVGTTIGRIYMFFTNDSGTNGLSFDYICDTNSNSRGFGITGNIVDSGSVAKNLTIPKNPETIGGYSISIEGLPFSGNNDQIYYTVFACDGGSGFKDNDGNETIGAFSYNPASQGFQKMTYSYITKPTVYKYP